MPRLTAPRPPALSRLLLTVSLPPGTERETIAADLDEEFERLRGERSIEAARSWYRRQSRRVMLAYAIPVRLRRAFGTRVPAAPGDRRRASRFGRRNPIERLLSDVRFVARGLRRSPGVAAVAILTLAIGIGGTATMFALVDAVLLRPLPFEQPEQLVTVQQELASRPEVPMGLAPANLRDLRRRNRVFTAIAAIAGPQMSGSRVNLTGSDEPVQVDFVRASAELFDVLRVRAVVGRTFRPEDDAPGAPAVAIISHGLWLRAFGGDPAVIGTTIQLDDAPYLVIGVTPRDFLFAYPNLVPETPDVWLPRPVGPNAWNNRWNASFGAVARLRPGVSLEQARVDIGRIGAALAAEYPEDMVVPAAVSPSGSDETITVSVESWHRDLVRSTRPLLLFLVGAAAVVLVIACVNVANLLLERNAARAREMSVRAALGAGGSRLAFQVLAESALLAGLGGLVGLVLAGWLTAVITVSAPGASFYNASLPLIARVAIDAGAVRVSLIVCVAAALLCGAAPALRAARTVPRLAVGATTGARTRRRGITGGQLLAAGQVALAIVVVIVAGLLATTLNRLLDIPIGFQPDNAAVMRVRLPRGRFAQQAATATAGDVAFSMRAERARLVQDVIQRLETLPEVEDVGAVDILPLSFVYSGPVHLQGVRPVAGDAVPAESIDGLEATGWALMQEATPGAFRALGIPLLRGRTFSWADAAAPVPAAVVNREFVEEFGIDGSAVGRRIQIISGGAWQPVEIIGVVDTVLAERYAGRWFDEGRRGYATVYLHYARPPLYARNQVNAHLELNVVARHRGDAAAVAASLQAVFHELAPEVPISSIQTLDEYAGEPLADRRFFSRVMEALALVSLFLSLVGIYGVMAFQVGRRTHEVGVRMALGARGHAVVGMMVGEGLRVAVLGALLGVLGALATTRLLVSWLYEVSPTEPSVVLTLAVLVVGMALFACWLPARRASRVDPIASLRAD